MQTDQVVVNPITDQRGLFSYVTCLLALLNRYEVEKIPIYADWTGADNYADPDHHPNVFNSYFEQPFVDRLNSSHQIIQTSEGSELLNEFFNHKVYSFAPEVRKKAARLVTKYLRVLPRITKLVDSFCDPLKNESILGVHIRSTDQFNGGHFHGQSLCLHRYLELIDQAVFQNQHAKIFAASDSQAVIELLRDNFRNLITYDCTRSLDNRALHLTEEFLGYQIGEDVLVESLILSRCQFFIASPSNVSTMVTFWNLDLPFVEAMKGILNYEPGL